MTNGGRRVRKSRGARRRSLNRPPIAHGFLHRVGQCFAGRMRSGAPSPWRKLRELLNDQVPSTGEPRQRAVRGDLIESLVMVVICLLSRMDLKSLRVGFQARKPGKAHDFVGLSRRTIASWCESGESTVSEILTLLRKAGLLHGPTWDGDDEFRIAQPYDGDDEKWLPAVRRFDIDFFTVLGFGHELHELRTTRQIRPHTAAELAAAQRARDTVDGIISRLERPPDG